ncbi:UbiD family decarboxylase [Nocardioides endophyticus]|uniref:UbiD family decarboxylase n=1 Tax=Nocardioides endophyticus TaxID=1353775 RepID=A0ABP8YXR0_9ACTN
MPKDLRTFIEQVQQSNPTSFLTTKKEVDPRYELTGVLRKFQEQGQFPMVLFEDVKGCDIPVLGNALGHRERLALLFDTDSNGLAAAYEKKQGQQIPPVEVEAADAPVKQVVQTGADVDVTSIATIVHCEGDGGEHGEYISSGVTLAKDNDTGVYNAGIYRIQVIGPTELRLDPGQYSHIWHLHHKEEERDQPLEIAIVIGHYPTLYMASQFRGSLEDDEIHVAGGLAGEAMRMVKAETLDMMVPADAEIVIEGRMLPHVREHEGPFGEFSWYVGPAHDAHVVEITAITRRSDAIYQDVFNAHPEHNLIGMVGREAGILSKVRAVVPSVKAVSMPFSAVCRFAAYVSIKKEYDGQGRNAALTALGADPFVKLCIVVDDDIDPYDESQVMWAVATRVRADKDVIIIPEAYTCELDPTAYSIEDPTKNGALNAKWMIDATKPVGLPFQELADVPAEVWKNIRLDDFFPAM